MTETAINVSGDMTVPNDADEQSTMSFKSLMQLPKHLSVPAAQEWVSQRRNNVRPWTTFLATSKFKTPPSIPRLGRRLVRNIEYFQSNYLFVFIGLIIFCLLTSPLLLVCIGSSLGLCYYLSLRNAERKLMVMGKEVPLAQQYLIVHVCSLPVFVWAGAGAAVFWVIGASFLVITGHAAFYNIEAILSPEEERFDLVMEEV